MVGPSTQDKQEQTRQAQQSAIAPAISQHPAYPMAGGMGYVPPPPPPLLPQGMGSLGNMTPKGIIVNLGKISLLTVCFSLMFFGVFTFLSGFLLGMWLAGPKSVSSSSKAQEAFSVGFLPAEQQALAPQTTPLPLHTNGINSGLKGKLGSITEEAVTNVTIPNVPNFLYPLVSATQEVAGKQLGHKVQQQIERQSTQPLTPPSQVQPSYQKNMNTQPSYQTIPSQGNTSGSISYPVEMLQKKQPPSHPTGSPVSEAANRFPLAENESYTIQLGVYAAKDNAYDLVNRLQALNHPSHVVEGKAFDGSPVYYVHSGLYKDYNTALSTISQFASLNIPGAIVVKVYKDKGAL